MRRLRLAVLLAVLLAGCRTTYLSARVGRHTLVTVDPASPLAHYFHTQRARAVVADFEARMARIPQRLVIQVEPRPFHPGDGWRVVRGAYYHYLRLVRVTSSGWRLPSLWHELCHAALAPLDAGHRDPRWEEWEAAGSAWRR